VLPIFPQNGTKQLSKDAMSQANITFEIVKGLRLFGGMHYTPTTGLRPTTALMYTRIINLFY
jgi:hypothetical protein